MNSLRSIWENASKFGRVVIVGTVALAVLLVIGAVFGESESGESGDTTPVATTAEGDSGPTEIDTEVNRATKQQTSKKPTGCSRAYSAEPSLAEGPVGSEIPTLHLGCGDIGRGWPLAVKEGLLQCEEEVVAELIVQRVTFEAPNGVVYAVNGHALDAEYPPIDPIWKKDPTGIAPRVSIGPLIDRGLELCEGAE